MGRATNWAQEHADFMDRMHALDKQMAEEHRKERNQQSEIEWRDDFIHSVCEENRSFKEQLVAKDAVLKESADKIAELEAKLAEKEAAVEEAAELIE